MKSDFAGRGDTTRPATLPFAELSDRTQPLERGIEAVHRQIQQSLIHAILVSCGIDRLVNCRDLHRVALGPAPRRLDHPDMAPHLAQFALASVGGATCDLWSRERLVLCHQPCSQAWRYAEVASLLGFRTHFAELGEDRALIIPPRLTQSGMIEWIRAQLGAHIPLEDAAVHLRSSFAGLVTEVLKPVRLQQTS